MKPGLSEGEAGPARGRTGEDLLPRAPRTNTDVQTRISTGNATQSPCVGQTLRTWTPPWCRGYGGGSRNQFQGPLSHGPRGGHAPSAALAPLSRLFSHLDWRPRPTNPSLSQFSVGFSLHPLARCRRSAVSLCHQIDRPVPARGSRGRGAGTCCHGSGVYIRSGERGWEQSADRGDWRSCWPRRRWLMWNGGSRTTHDGIPGHDSSRLRSRRSPGLQLRATPALPTR